jgi:predicted dienelactone hydrolase
VTAYRLRAAFPRPTGSYLVGVTTLRLVREAAEGVAPGSYEVEVWYPAQQAGSRAAYGTGVPGLRRFAYHRLLRTNASRDVPLAGSSQRFPVVVYVAGWGGQRTDNTVLAEDLASHGFVVAALSDVTFDSPPVPELSTPLDFSSKAAYARTLEVAGARVAYEAERASRVLDELQVPGAGRFAHRLNAAGAGILGFSFGGAVALATCARDPRFVAAANLDGWLFGVRNAAECPYLLVSDNAPLPGAKDLSATDPVQRFESTLTVADDPVQRAALAYDGYSVIVGEATHLSFTDVPFYSPLRRFEPGSTDPKRVSGIVSRYVLGFFERYVAGRAAPLLDRAAPAGSAVTFKHEAGGSRRRAWAS